MNHLKYAAFAKAAVPFDCCAQARSMDDYSSIIMRLVTSRSKLRASKSKLHAARLTSAFDIELRVRAHEKGMKMAAEM